MVITPVITVITLFRTMPLNSYSSKNHQPPPRKEMSEKVVLSNKVPNLSSLHLTQNQHRKISPWQFKPLSLKSNSPPCTPRCARLIPGWGWAQDRKARDRKYWTPLSTGSQGTGSQVLDATANKTSALHNGGVTGGDQDTTMRAQGPKGSNRVKGHPYSQNSNITKCERWAIVWIHSFMTNTIFRTFLSSGVESFSVWQNQICWEHLNFKTKSWTKTSTLS